MPGTRMLEIATLAGALDHRQGRDKVVDTQGDSGSYG